MDRRFRRIAFVAVLILAITGCRRAVSSEEPVSLTIAHINDLHGHVKPDKNNRGGLTRIAGALNELLRQYPDLIFLNSGDLITGTPLSNLTKGAAIFKLANMLQFTAFVPGNHEFDYGVEQLESFMKNAQFPFICANMRIKNGKLLAGAPYIVAKSGGVQVGIIGIITPATKFMNFPENTADIEFDDPAPVMKKLMPEVRGKAKFIVAMTHIGLEDDRKLASEVNGINLIVGGHSHDYLKQAERINDTYIVQAGCNGLWLGVVHVKLEKSTGKVLSLVEQAIYMDPKTPEDSAVADAVAEEESKLPVKLSQPVGRASRHLDQNEDLAPWIASLMKRHMNAEIGIVNVGAVRSDLNPGTITYEDLFDVMPFDDHVVLARMSGRKINEWIEKKAIVLDRPIQINPDKTYSVGTLDFVATMYRIAPENVKKTNMLVRDLMIEDLKARGTLP